MMENCKWVKHHIGDVCPIPEAKAGEYMLRWKDGEETAPEVLNAKDWEWFYCRIVAYKLIIRK